jgi:HD-GYP domain-containing protein (c-di-GMP phosphodiesterase class II)
MGDRIMCEFGAPNNYDTHSLLAVLAGIKMQEKLLQSDFPWQMRIGIGSGSAITGLIGFKRQTYTAIGDVVNVASRLEEICPPTKVVIDDETYHNVKDFINAERVRDFGQGLKRQEDFELLEKIKANEERLKTNADNSEALVETGKIYFQLMQISEAIKCFERAHALEPDNTEIKLLYADASLKKDEFEKIRIRGKKDRISVYEVTGIKDIMLDRKRILEGFYQKYKYVEELIEVPEDVILPVEALDGSIGHSKAVAIVSYAIADCLDLTEQEKKNILIAGYLQDIGKQIVPSHILNRKGSLSETEKKEIDEHPIEGSKILKLIGYDAEDILEIVLHHHERYDGEGYPFKKRREEIPLGARISGLADSYNALISWRPYREGWEQRTALGEIQKGTNEGKFDPQLSRILIDLMS